MLNQEKLKTKLTKEKNILGVYLFGSSVGGKTTKLSDIDIGIIFDGQKKVFKNSITSLHAYNHLFELFSAHFKNPDKLDLVFLQQAPLSLQKEAVNQGKIFYVKNYKKLLDYKEKILLEYADIKPLMDIFHQQVAQTRLAEFKTRLN